jgi:signal peptidase II
MSDEDKVKDEPTEDKPADDTPRVKPLDKKKWQLFLIVAVLSLVADQATKIWARAELPVERAYPRHALNEPCKIVEDLIPKEQPDGKAYADCHGTAVTVIENYWDWRLSMNTGSAFGLFSGTGSAGRILLSIIGVLAVIGMVWMLRKARPDQRVLHWALAFVAGGAVGNLIDRIYFGVVTDFILWHYHKKEWPVFNIADVVLVVGVGLMFIDIQKESKREKALKKARQEKAKKRGLVKEFRID